MSGDRSMPIAWVARVTGILLAAMLTMAWWAESGARREPLETGEVSGSWMYQWAILTHVLPAVALIVAIVVGWGRPLLAAIVFIAHAVIDVFSYAGEWGYAPQVSGPPLVIGAIYLADWWIWRRKV